VAVEEGVRRVNLILEEPLALHQEVARQHRRVFRALEGAPEREGEEVKPDLRRRPIHLVDRGQQFADRRAPGFVVVTVEKNFQLRHLLYRSTLPARISSADRNGEFNRLRPPAQKQPPAAGGRRAGGRSS
jgi:hypothetical protein